MAVERNPVNVLTNRNGNTRTGAHLAERRLNTDNVNVDTFGKLFSRTVDGDLYAQPLIVSGVDIGKKIRNVVYLATSRNWVYAYDADDHAACLPLWQVNLGRPVPREDIFVPRPGLYMNFANEVGITSTPVIDVRGEGKGVLYVVAKSRVDNAPAAQKEGFEYKIHALDIKTGKPFKFGQKKEGESGHKNGTKITGQAYDSETGRSVHFDAKWHLNRPGLLLLDHVLYLAFGSHGDEGEFWGWIMAYDAKTLNQLAVHCTALAWGEGGVWQSGCGLAGETVTGPDGDKTTFVYAVVGNGQKPIPDKDDGPVTYLHTIPDKINVPFYGNSILKLTLVRTSEPAFLDRPRSQGDPRNPFRFDVVDWFTTSDCLDLNENDEDLIGGPVLFDAQGIDGKPRGMVLGGGKDGKFYLADRNNLGKWQPVAGRDPYKLTWWDSVAKQEKTITIALPYQVNEGDINAHKHWVRSVGGKPRNQIIQDDQLCNYHIHGAPTLWQKSDSEVTAYVWSEKDFCKAITFKDGRFSLLQSTSLYGFPSRELRMPGGILALSADGAKEGTGIVWASHPTNDDGMNKTVKGTLRAFDARDLNVELWNSDKNPDGEDRLGDFAKFCPPVIANGKVYMATFSRELVVYGLLADIGRNRINQECDIWSLMGIGGGVQGSCKFSCAQYTVHTTGQGFTTPEQSGTIGDSFYFPHLVIDSLQQPEISITARVSGIRSFGIDSPNPDARVGIMIRAFDDPGALPTVPYAAVVFSSLSGALFQRRLKDKVASIQDGPIEMFPPNWLRLSCESAESSGLLSFKAEVSSDGASWRQVGTDAVIEMTGRVMVGLVATVQSNSPSAQVEARYSDVQVAPWTG
jgi:hypothetical protein